MQCNLSNTRHRQRIVLSLLRKEADRLHCLSFSEVTQAARQR